LRRWNRDCAMIFQQFNLVPRLDVLTNVLLGRLNHRSTVSSILNMFTREERIMAIAALERLGIEQTATAAGRHVVRWPTAARGHRPRLMQRAAGTARRRADRLARPAECQDRHGRAEEHQRARRHHRDHQPAHTGYGAGLLPADHRMAAAALCSTAAPRISTARLSSRFTGPTVRFWTKPLHPPASTYLLRRWQCRWRSSRSCCKAFEPSPPKSPARVKGKSELTPRTA